jgi:hypothetical protein
MSLPDDWTLAGLIRYGLATAVGLFILNVFFESNVRAFIEERGWDKVLSETWRKMRPLTERRGFWFAFGLVAGSAVVAWLIPEIGGSNPTVLAPTAPTVIHDSPTAEDIAKATEPIQAQLDAANQQVAAARNSQINLDVLTRNADQLRQQVFNLKQAQENPQYFGVVNTLNAFSAAGGISRKLADEQASILLTANGNWQLKRSIMNIFEIGGRGDNLFHSPSLAKIIVDLPRTDIDLDAPKIPFSDRPGIIIHGDTAAKSDLMLFFDRCFAARQTSQMVPGLAEYYKVPKLIWIEIGPGNPWKPQFTMGLQNPCLE